MKNIKHEKLLSRLLVEIKVVDFREQAELTAEDASIRRKHYLVCCIENLMDIAQRNKWGICKSDDSIFLYNGTYWSLVNCAEFQVFLGKAAEKMGVNKFDARHYVFREQLYKQFLAVANLPKPEQSNEIVLINLKNGTLEISPSRQELRLPRQEDFISYQLHFEYNPEAEAPMFKKYLDTIQPDIDRQKILAEYLGYLFIKNNTLKIEKALLLYGLGANGKSVYFEIVNALLGGSENVSNYSLQSLTSDRGYCRAELANKLVNYASEINGKLETSVFKLLVSGEPVEARFIRGKPFTLTNYAKLIFNCNELPKDVEQSLAYFRRFLIVPFDVTIPEADQDKELSKKIIETELSGVLNWVLDGLKRLLSQKNFTYSEAVANQTENYKMQSDSVKMFLVDEGFEKSYEPMEFKKLYIKYNRYCKESGCIPCAKNKVSDRLRNAGVFIERKNYGLVVYLGKARFQKSA
jgi:putative DNA primase/helicase